MKKYIALTLVLIIVLSAFGLSGCSENSNTVTLYELNNDYEKGTPITKNMLKERKILLSEGFVASNGKVYTQETLSTLRLVTKDNWDTLISRDSVLIGNIKAGTLLLLDYVTDKPIDASPTMGPFNRPIEP